MPPNERSPAVGAARASGQTHSIGAEARDDSTADDWSPPELPAELAALDRQADGEAASRRAPVGAAVRLTAQVLDGAKLSDFWAYLPTHSYVFVPTREMWPASAINGALPRVKVPGVEKPIAPASWLDKHRPVQQAVWSPGEPEIIEGRVMAVAGWVDHPGAAVFNLYRPPAPLPPTNGERAQRWLDHLQHVYPEDWRHILCWLAHRVQRPNEKCNHALVLGGQQGIGKDSLLEPVKRAVGPWNCSEISPQQMLGRFNGWAKAVLVTMSEARDLGDANRFALYEHSKTVIAAPPNVIRVDEKHLREHYVANVLGLVITTNNASDGLYLPADDRRHFVAWSQCERSEFSAEFWQDFHGYLERGGAAAVGHYLHAVDLSGFDPKAPPPKTPAFWTMVAAGEAPESGELRDVLDELGNPDAVTLDHLVRAAERCGMAALAAELGDRAKRRMVPHRLERVGFVPVRSDTAADGLFKIGGRRQAVYARRSLPLSERLRAASQLAAEPWRST